MNIYAEIITIGDEILFGQIVDTNSQWLATHLTNAGIRVIRRTSIGDKREEILAALADAQTRASIIITTGGLGPTKDDITKHTIAEFFGVEMTHRPEVLAHVQELFAARKRVMSDLNNAQALVPANGEVIHNAVGTAPGMWFLHEGKVFISMPGVPYEMKKMMAEIAIPRLQQTFRTPHIYHQMIRTIGIPESTLAEIISDWEDALPENIKLAYLPKMGQVRLRLTSTGYNLEALESAVAAEIEKLKPLIDKHVYAYDDEEIVHTLGRMLEERGQWLATAESCTGGLIASKITESPGCSAYYKGGIVAYSNEVKHSQLDVQEATLMQFGAVSEQTVQEMAANVRIKYGADYGLAVSGIAGPGGGTPEKPVGTVWIGYADAHTVFAKQYSFTKDRDMNMQLACNNALNLLRTQMLAQETKV